MKNKNPYLFVVSAPSGAGKTTLCKKLLKDFLSLTLSISSTTRPPRGTEKQGVDYFFLNRNEFEDQVQKGLFAEWASVHNNYYGTSREFIEKALRSNQSVLLDIDVQGAEQLHTCFPEECRRIFISPPNIEILEERLRKRGTDTEESIQRRLLNTQIEMEAGKNFNHIIINDSLERAYMELKNLLENFYGLTSNSSEEQTPATRTANGSGSD